MSPNVTIGLSFALFIVWMQRNHRWSLMIHTMDGTYKLSPRT